jgi:hypothetical protein
MIKLGTALAFAATVGLSAQLAISAPFAPIRLFASDESSRADARIDAAFALIGMGGLSTQNRVAFAEKPSAKCAHAVWPNIDPDCLIAVDGRPRTPVRVISY